MAWIFLVRLSVQELLGVIVFFACAPGIWEDVGVCKSEFKIYLPISFDILGIHCRHLSKSAATHNLSEPTHVQCMILFAVCYIVCCFFAVARMGWVGKTRRGSRRAFKCTNIFTP